MHPGPQLMGALQQHLGQPLQAGQFQPLGGGSINQVYRLQRAKEQCWILKINAAAQFPQLFALEAKGLESLRPHIRVPQVLAVGESEGMQYLLLEHIAEATPDAHFWKAFGAALAYLHTQKGAQFGWSQNNYMGAVPQDNTPDEDWASFFAHRRLLPLTKKCAAKGLLGHKEVGQLERLCSNLQPFFSKCAPALLHGDLWGGNFLCGRGAVPVLIDPAVYYGHPAVDMGMTTLFGGFDAAFYEAYHYHAPLPQNHRDESELCNLYPLLIHLLLFGAGYLSGIKRTLNRFVPL